MTQLSLRAAVSLFLWGNSRYEWPADCGHAFEKLMPLERLTNSRAVFFAWCHLSINSYLTGTDTRRCLPRHVARAVERGVPDKISKSNISNRKISNAKYRKQNIQIAKYRNRRISKSQNIESQNIEYAKYRNRKISYRKISNGKISNTQNIDGQNIECKISNAKYRTQNIEVT